MLIVRQARSREELEQIIRLQKKYLRGKTSPEEESLEGFVTVEHDLPTLEQMHRLEPSIVAVVDDQLAGYALVMPPACAELIPVLMPMFRIFPSLTYQGRPFNDFHFYVMGQICVDKSYRRQGIFDRLYQQHKEEFQHKYDFVVTEISTRNQRSLRAHQRVGFDIIHTYRDELDDWYVVVWDWGQKSA